MRSRAQVAVKTSVVATAVIAMGTVGYMHIEDLPLIDAFYMTIITVTTIGFREVAPLSTPGRLFTVFMAFAGVSVILLVASEIGRVVVQSDIRRLIGHRRDVSMIKKLSGHIVVCGYGRMGRAVVEVLRKSKVQFVVVESRPEVCQRMEEDHIPFVDGDATQEATQRAARVQTAGTFLSCLADDAHNVFAILLARQLNPDVITIARAVEEESEERLRLAGAQKVLNPYRLGGMRLAHTALKPTVVDFVEASLHGTSVELELAEIAVHPKSELAGKTLAGAEVRRRFGIIVVALKRGEEDTFNPEPDSRIEAGDVLVALGPIQALERMEKVCMT